jgi:hypothetical protein
MGIGFWCSFDYMIAALSFEPFDTVDKVGMTLMHHKFNGVKIPAAIEASCQIVSCMDGRVCAMAIGAVEGGGTVFVSGGNRKNGFDDAVYGDFIAQKRQFPG